MFIKEKNLLTFTTFSKKTPEGNNYYFDFNTGKTFRLDNQKEIKKPLGVIETLQNIIEENEDDTITHDYGEIMLFLYKYVPYEERPFVANLLERMLAIDKRLDYYWPLNIRNLKELDNNFKYMRNFPGKKIIYSEFMRYVLSEKLKTQNSDWAKLSDIEIEIMQRYFTEYSIHDKKMQKEILNLYIRSYLRDLFSDNEGIFTIFKYVKYCEFLGHKFEHKNFLREFAEVQRSYTLLKEEIDSNAIVENYKKQINAWNFKYGDFSIVIPNCAKDLIVEGTQMHHCVGRYVSDIVDNKRYICFVRKNNNIDEPYITCEILLDGRIGQYYLAYDRAIHTPKDIEFREAFQEYLNSVWNKED